MQTKLLAAALVASLSLLQAPAFAQQDGRAQLQLTVVDETNAPLANATVTVFTMQGPRTVNTDEKGVVVLADLPAAMTQWWARTSSELSGAEAKRLKPGENKETVTVHPTRESGS